MKHLTPSNNVPSATEGTADSLAAPGRVGAGGTSYLRRFDRFQAALASARCRATSAFKASRSFFSLCLKYSFVAPITTTRASTPQITDTGLLTSMGYMEWFILTAWVVSCCLLSVVIFHWVLVPFFDWLAERLS